MATKNTTSLIAVAVIFDHFDPTTQSFTEVEMPLGCANAYHVITGEWVKKVVWQDGAFSWGKNWEFAEGQHAGQIERISAGAYGDMVVWTHPAAASTKLAEAA